MTPTDAEPAEPAEAAESVDDPDSLAAFVPRVRA